MSGFSFWMPLLIVLTSLVASVFSFLIDEKKELLRGFLNVFFAFLNLGMVGWLMIGVFNQESFEFKMPLFLDFNVALSADPFSLLFVALSSVLWLLTTIYAVGYLKGTENQSRFFGFFNLCVFSTTAIALSGNLFTFLIFYELLTVSTYPLVVHKGTKEALKAGRTYLIYTISAGAVLLFAMVWLSSLVGAVEFAERGIIYGLDPKYYPQLITIFFMLITGFGVKAALFPLHGWLPIAMIAPAPVSALLHAVAVVKAGAFGILRTIYDIYGIDFCRQEGLLFVIALITSVTIIYGSVKALSQNDIKRRLAYSTISQVSYIILGIATVSVTASIGGIVHLVHQGVMKITLFFCAGNFHHELNITKVTEMDGLGRKMPWTMGAFTIGALGMIGVPPTAGFISKWFLGLGAIQAEQPWILGVFLLSSLLNATYFLPPIYRGWFKKPEQENEEISPAHKTQVKQMLLIPLLITAALTILIGFFANLPIFPLRWAMLTAFREYGS